jgi:hypothetical protein
MPLFWRAFAYFCYRYFLRGGFLEGREGFLWHFLQGWWYRTLVDAKVFEIKRESGGDPQKMLALLRGKVWDEDLVGSNAPSALVQVRLAPRVQEGSNAPSALVQVRLAPQVQEGSNAPSALV